MNSTTKSVAVLDYGVGNVKSIMNALAILPCEPVLTRDEQIIRGADKIILPGVGAFGYCMSQLNHFGLADLIRSVAAEGKALLGICVGMQMLFDSSEEHGTTEGLGLIGGAVKRLPVTVGEDIRLPHIGWSSVCYRQPAAAPLFSALPQQENYYFVHSFACEPDDKSHTLAQAQYADVTFTASVIADNVCGVQYHPERSGKAGLALLENFVAA